MYRRSDRPSRAGWVIGLIVGIVFLLISSTMLLIFGSIGAVFGALPGFGAIGTLFGLIPLGFVILAGAIIVVSIYNLVTGGRTGGRGTMHEGPPPGAPTPNTLSGMRPPASPTPGGEGAWEPPPAPAPDAPDFGVDPGDFERRLRTLDALRRDGLITPMEYERKRAEILAERW
jgi:uncharacterized membrane protein